MLISWKLNKCYFERGSEWKKFTFLPLFTSKGSLFLTRQLFAKMQGGEDFLFFCIFAVWMFGIAFLGVLSQVLEGIMVLCQASCFTLSMSFLIPRLWALGRLIRCLEAISLSSFVNPFCFVRHVLFKTELILSWEHWELMMLKPV